MQELSPGANCAIPSAEIAVSVTCDFPLDVSAVLLGADRRVRSDADLIFYNNPVGPGVTFMGQVPGGITALRIETSGVPTEVETVVITASLGGTGPATFAQAGRTVVTVHDATGVDAVRFEVAGLSTETALVCVEVYRRAGAWKIRAVGQGYDAGLAGIATDFGIDISDDDPVPETQAPEPQAPEPLLAPSASAAAVARPPVVTPAHGGQSMNSDLFAPAHAEVAGAGMQKQGGKMCKVALDGEVMARSGSMVAYQGDMQFVALGSGGIGNVIKQKLTGEGVALMKVTGRGDLFLANAAGDVHLIDLTDNDGLTINGANVLAFEPTLHYKIERVHGAAMASGAGLFNCVFTGHGRIAITTKGAPVVLTVDQPTFADPQAAVAWSASLRTGVQSNDQFNLGTLMGRSTGERFTLSFSGQGFVVVQPSEEPPGGFIGGTGKGDQAGVGGALGGLLGR
ncbi:MAG: AIM24 family protein [Mycobacteriaceae bacterium]